VGCRPQGQRGYPRCPRIHTALRVLHLQPALCFLCYHRRKLGIFELGVPSRNLFLLSLTRPYSTHKSTKHYPHQTYNPATTESTATAAHIKFLVFWWFWSHLMEMVNINCLLDVCNLQPFLPITLQVSFCLFSLCLNDYLFSTLFCF
jgi:hypothetical protein